MGVIRALEAVAMEPTTVDVREPFAVTMEAVDRRHGQALLLYGAGRRAGDGVKRLSAPLTRNLPSLKKSGWSRAVDALTAVGCMATSRTAPAGF